MQSTRVMSPQRLRFFFISRDKFRGHSLTQIFKKCFFSQKLEKKTDFFFPGIVYKPLTPPKFWCYLFKIELTKYPWKIRIYSYLYLGKQKNINFMMVFITHETPPPLGWGCNEQIPPPSPPPKEIEKPTPKYPNCNSTKIFRFFDY